MHTLHHLSLTFEVAKNRLAKVRRHKANAFISNFRTWDLRKGGCGGGGGDGMISTSRVLLMKQIVFCEFCFSLSIANGILETEEFYLDFSSLHEILLTLKDGIVTYAYILETEGNFAQDS
ncbi:hypothetical protein CEXT_98831 [Caerostris extrusa]|uniref:Uncharacterized protein n=1 Tax=Caerostris extrusa TaxID=172846 RepID=A0AAV4XY22_CAEEX|nr:hypothetical protein CEXT_98831 [Caerostris extrusa]